MKILIVDDDENCCDLLEAICLQEKNEVIIISDGLDALNIIEKEKPNLLFLDIILKNESGLNIIEKMRLDTKKYGEPYVIAVTGNQISINEIVKYKFNDFIEKPFKVNEIKYKIRMLKDCLNSKKTLKYRSIEICYESYNATEYGEPLELTKKEFELLSFFIQNREKILTREKIMDYVWGKEYAEGSDRVVDLNVSRLRKKSKIIDESIVIKRGIGYQLRNDTEKIRK